MSGIYYKKVIDLRELMQILQIGMFIIPIVSLWTMGALLFLRPVNILHQRWRLLVLLPLLIANLLAALENNLFNESGFTVGWGFWMVVGIDLVLGVGLWIASSGFLVFGLGAEEVEEVLTEGFREMGMQVTANEEEETLLLKGRETVRLLRVDNGQEEIYLKVHERFNETIVQADSQAGRQLFKDLKPKILLGKDISRHKSRATGVLYLILGLVFAVLGWIFFFEPRLILLE